MRILTALTYYRPHTSGLTIYAERLARALVRRGHEVTVLTSRYLPELPREEVCDGVRVLRVPVAMRLGKGVLMPALGLVASREVWRHDAVHLHLPQFDAAGIGLRGRLLRRPTVITYHCDLELPPGLFNRVANTVVHAMDHVAARAAHRVAVYTEDFADHSPFLRRYRRKRAVILPPVELPPGEPIPGLADAGAPSGPVIGMATRFASEKGVEVLLDALGAVRARFPGATVLFAGQHEGVWGEEPTAPGWRRASSRCAPKVAGASSGCCPRPG
jgi:glycosyltransferase involved in cell wall biosynthesis